MREVESMEKNYSKYDGNDDDLEDFFYDNCEAPSPEPSQADMETVRNGDDIPDEQNVHSARGPSHPKRKSKLLIVIGVIVISAVVITASFLVILIGNESSENSITKFYERNGGPQVNLESFALGNIQPLPRQDYIATYGYYYQNSRVGYVTITSAGEEIFQGTNCLKIEGGGSLDVVVEGNSIKYTFDSLEYHNLDTNFLVYTSLTLNYVKPLQSTQTVEYWWDQENGEMTTITSSMGQTSTARAQLPEDYWELSGFLGAIEVGYTKQFTYTMDIEQVDDIDVALLFEVTTQEDVTVSNGFYEDCFVIELNQQMTVLGSPMDMTYKVWVDEQGIMPQAEIGMSLGILSNFILTLKLDEYYTTVDPGDLLDQNV
jgi:hypothetical protein